MLKCCPGRKPAFWHDRNYKYIDISLHNIARYQVNRASPLPLFDCLLLLVCYSFAYSCVALLHRCLCLSSSYRLVASSDLLAFGPYLGFDIVTARVQLASTREASLFFCQLKVFRVVAMHEGTENRLEI